jgi:predicted phage gp36 major capsid-like protein
MKEIKSDLIQRITDNKSDIKDFKADQTKLFEKFEKESKEKIEKGLALDLQNAIDKIMKESFSSELKDLSEQVAALTTRLENISSKEETDTTPLQKENKFNGEKIQSTGIKPTNNAFDEQSK